MTEQPLKISDIQDLANGSTVKLFRGEYAINPLGVVRRGHYRSFFGEYFYIDTPLGAFALKEIAEYNYKIIIQS